MTLASLCSWAGQFVSYLVTNPEDRFSHDAAHMMDTPWTVTYHVKILNKADDKKRDPCCCMTALNDVIKIV